MAQVNMRFRGCFAAADLSDKNVQAILDQVARYDTGDIQKDYIAAVEDILSDLNRSRSAIVKAITDATKPAQPVVTDEQARKAWFDFAPDFAPKYQMLSDDALAKWKAALSVGEGRRKAAKEISDEYNTASATEAWNEMVEASDPDYVAFESLDDKFQRKWIDAFKRRKSTYTLYADIVQESKVEQPQPEDKVSKGPAADLYAAMDQARTATDIRVFAIAISEVMDMAYLNADSNNIKNGLIAKSLEFLRTLEATLKPGDKVTDKAKDERRLAMLQEFVRIFKDIDQLQYGPHKDAPERGLKKGDVNPWYAFAVSNGILSTITKIKPNLIIKNMPDAEIEARLKDGSIRLTNLPESTAKKFADVVFEPKAKTNTAQQASITPTSAIRIAINDLWGGNRVSIYQKGQIAKLEKQLTELYASIPEGARDFLIRGFPMRDYFRADGTPKGRESVGGYYVVDTYEKSAAEVRADTARYIKAVEEGRAAEQAARAEQFEAERARKEKPADTGPSSFDAKDGAFRRDDGKPITSTVPVGRIRMVIASLMSKFRNRPNVQVFANLADLKAKDRALYNRAKAAYEGDFDAVASNAMGYSFGGDTVLVFSDFIRTEQQLRFLMAHEVLGHYGFASIMPQKDLEAALNEVYDSDPEARAVIDGMMVTEKMSKLEAIEEYLSDNAAEVETSVLYRFWTRVKNFLNKLGMTFKDDMARHLVGQARRYVRNGKGGYVTNGATMGDRIQSTTGRFQRAAPATLGDAVKRSFDSMAYTQAMSPGPNGGTFSFAESWKNFFAKRENVPGTVSRILEAIQTLDNKARRSYGLSLIYNMLEKQQQFARRLLAKYQRMTSVTHSFKTTEADKLKAGFYLSHAALLRSRQATDEVLRKQQSLVSVAADGSLQVNEEVLKQIKEYGLVTAEEFRKGFDITYDDGAGGTAARRVQDNVDENSVAWQVYLEQREAIAEAAIDMMLSNFEAARDESVRIMTDLNYKRGGLDMFSAEDLATIREVSNRYVNKMYEGSTINNASKNIRDEAKQKAEDLVVAFGRALFNPDVLAVWLKNPDAKPEIVNDLKEFQKAEYDDIRRVLPSLAAKVKSDQESFRIQKAIRDQFMFDLQAQNAEYYAMRTIMGAYVPFTRRGNQQVRMVAKDKAGRYVTLHESAKTVLPYYQFDTRAEALQSQKELNDLFGKGQSWKLLVDDGSAEGKETEVYLTAEVARVRQSADLTEAVNFNEFIYALNRLNINIKPNERERIVTTLTDTNARARKNLFRSGTPGWDKDVVRSASEYLESTAHTAARKRFRHRLDDIFLREENWLGDDQKLADLKAAVDNAPNEEARAEARREYSKYAYMYQYMAGEMEGRTVEIGGAKKPTLGRGQDYREEGKSILRWYSESGNIIDSTEDALSGETGSQLKMWVVIMQLGGSVASAVVNFSSLLTHSIPYLSTYNEQTGFGGGFSVNKAANAVWRAAADLKNFNLSETQFLEDILKKKNWADYGMTQDEAEFLATATNEGILQAAQFNALIGSARGQGSRSNKMQAAIQTWMSMFSYTEQMNRRATAMAAYRLEKERAKATGKSDAEASAQAAQFARDAVNSSQGEYAMFNRPKMARGNMAQYIFMYKQFTIITVQLMKALPFKGRALMIGFLLLASGLRGLPFAEDLMDLIDTLMQKFGLTTASVEKEMMEFLDAVAPGMTPTIMKGVLDQMLGTTVSTRLGMGDLIPLSGSLRAGADPLQELKDFAGPAIGGLIDTVATAGNVARYGGEVIGIKDDTTSFVDILRNSPVAAFRAVADSAVYMADGQITNRQGQVVSSDVGAMTILTRALGFYPLEATMQNDIVRLSKQIDAYGKEIKADYVQAYRKAYLDKDQERMQQIREYVREWNADAEGTGLEIRGFEKSALRSAKEMSRPTLARYLKSAPEGIKPETVEMLQAMGYDVEDL